MAAAVTDELVYKIGLIWDKIGFNGLEASIGKSIDMMAKASAAAAIASTAIFALGKNFAETTDNLIKTSGRVNAITSDIQKLTFAAEDNGATMDDVTSSLGSLAKAQEQLLQGKGDFEAWGQLGVNPTDYEDTASLLLDISDRVKGLSNTQAIDLMNRVGISPKLLQALQQGKDGLKSLGDEAEALGLISNAKMLQSSQTFMSGWQRATTIFKGVMNKVSSNLLDSTINPALVQFNKFASKHMKEISAVLTKIFTALAKASEWIFSLLNRLSQPFITLVNLMGGLENAAIALGVAIAAIKWQTIKAMLPAILIVGALYLAFDELMSFLDGKESFLGNLFTSMGVSAEHIKIVLSSISELLGMVATGWTLIFTRGGDALDGLGILIDQNLIQPIKDALKYLDDLLEKVSKPIKSSFDFASDTFEGAKNFFGFGEKNTPAPVPINTNNNISIQVDGSKDPVAVGAEVRRVLNEEMNKSAMRGGH